MAKETRNGRKRPNNVPAENEGDGGIAVEEETPFKYYVKGERPRADGAFFELLLIKILEERGALPDFDEVWPRCAQAMAGLNTLRLSQLSADELDTIIGSVGGEFAARLHGRTAEVILWADAFWSIRQIYGSFRQYVRSFDTDGYEALIGDLGDRLNGLSANLIVAYLRDAGEKIPNLPQIDPPEAPPQRAAKQPPPQGKPNRTQGGGGRRRSGRGGNKQKGGGERPVEGQPPAQPKPAKAIQEKGQEKGQGKNRRGRRGFFRRKRGAKPKAEATGTA